MVTDEMVDAAIKANTEAKLFGGEPRDWVRAALEAALSAAEPVAWGNFKSDGTLVGLAEERPDSWTGAKPLYAAPPAPSVAVNRHPLAQRLSEYVDNPHHINPISDAFKTLIREAASALSAQVQDVAGWQPIETAPKDGTRVIGADQLYVIGDIYWQCDGNETETGKPGWINGMHDRYEKDYVFNPTHWMPLPPLPAAPAKQEGGHD